jgi:hypothetical protein
MRRAEGRLRNLTTGGLTIVMSRRGESQEFSLFLAEIALSRLRYQGIFVDSCRLEAHVSLARAAESGALDSLECPDCHNLSVPVHVTRLQQRIARGSSVRNARFTRVRRIQIGQHTTPRSVLIIVWKNTTSTCWVRCAFRALTSDESHSIVHCLRYRDFTH